MTAATLMWCGGATTSSLQPVFRLDGGAATVRAAFAATADFANPVYSDPRTPDEQGYCRPGDVTGLDPDTRYHWCAEVDGTLDLDNIARARTLPSDPGVVKLTFASCWSQMTATGITIDHPVGAAAAAQAHHGALLHMFLGDFGYANIAVNDQNRFRTQYETMHAIGNISTLARSVTWDHMWDDHDFGPDNSNSTHAGCPAAQAVYRQVVPHYPFATDDGKGVYHAFTIGNVRIIVTDLRSYRTPDTADDDTSKTMLGDVQKNWLKAEWLAAKQAGQLIVWSCTQVWCIDGPYITQGINADSDHWGAFATERAELDNYRSEHGITNMVILTGDSHAIGYKLDADYSDNQDVPTAVFMSAAMSRAAAFRQAAWDRTSAPAEGDGHYSLLTITKGPAGGWGIGCAFHHVDPATGTDDTQFTATLTLGLPTPVRMTIHNSTGQTVNRRDRDGHLLATYTLT